MPWPPSRRSPAGRTSAASPGGAGIKVRIVKGANLAMERVDATVHDWPLATWSTKQESDTNYKRMLVRALTPEDTAVVRIGVAGHNLFDLAFAWLLAERRGVTGRVEIEMLLGMAAAQAEAVRATTGGLLLYTPVVRPEEFDAAISYLVRRLEENASTDNFMSGLFELDDAAIYQRERDRFAASLADLDLDLPAPRRTQDRLHPRAPACRPRVRERTGHRSGARRQSPVGPRHPGPQREVEAGHRDDRRGRGAERGGAAHDRLAVGAGRRRSGARFPAPIAANCSTGSARCSACSAAG